jgi:hypothetical protein
MAGPDIVKWILKTFQTSKADWEKTKNIKHLNSCGKILRSFINQVQDKRAGISQEYKIVGREMADYLSSEISKQKYNVRKHGQLYPIVTNIQYATKHLGVTAVQGSALKRRLTPGERRRVRRLRSGPPGEDDQSEQPEDDLGANDLHPGPVGNGSS